MRSQNKTRAPTMRVKKLAKIVKKVLTKYKNKSKIDLNLSKSGRLLWII